MDNNKTDKELKKLLEKIEGKDYLKRMQKAAVDENLKTNQINLKS